MNLPVIRGLIDRRMLINYRIEPSVMTGLLPAPFRPKLHRGFGLAGLCLIRLKQVRPKFMPRWLGISSENAATRFAVEWNDDAGRHEGVYVRRRDTNNWLNTIAGGRIFPGIHSHGRFQSDETATHFHFSMQSDDGAMAVELDADVATQWPSGSIFDSLAEASSFFEAGSLGYSATADRSRFQGLELRCYDWRVEPLSVNSLHSNYFDDPNTFPAGSIHFDCALLMRGIEHEWHGKPEMCCDQSKVGVKPESLAAAHP